MAEFVTRMKKSVKEVMKYAFWGAATTILNYILFIAFIKAGIHYVISNIVSYGIAVVASYWVNEKFVFGEQKKKRMQKLAEYILNRVALLITDNLLLVILVEAAGVSAEWAKVFISAVLLLANYMISKFWIFK